MEGEFSRIFRYAGDFYFKRLGLIVLFSIPFVFGFLITVFVSAPTYLALGGVFLRTGSLPEMSIIDMAITAAAYALSVFLIADSIVNINIIVRSRRTFTEIRKEIVDAMGTHATRIFYIYTLFLLLLFILQIITYDNPVQSWIYPLITFVLSFLLFFVAPAVVIDNLDTPTAIRHSAEIAFRKPVHFVVWTCLTFVTLSVLKLVADFIFPSPYSSYFVLLVNSLLILPYLIVLQTQMYMEKYPLAR